MMKDSGGGREAGGGFGRGGAKMAKQKLAEAEVICATCIGSGSDMLSQLRFHTVLIDECTQATETSVLVAIAQGCQQLVLVGDHCQLPPTVVSEEAQRRGLAVSLFSRFASQGVRPVLLDTQYRMHPSIAQFPSDAFYAGQLKSGVRPCDREAPQGFNWPDRRLPVAFTNSGTHRNAPEGRSGTSYINEKEARQVISAAVALVRGGSLPGGVMDIGVITPYSGQSRFIKRQIYETPALREVLDGIEISTVDGFQGREKEVIIFSAVRSNDEGKVGFTGDWRRMNVAFTRPKRGLIVYGNRRTLSMDRVWNSWISWASSRGVIVGENGGGKYTPVYLGDALVGATSEGAAKGGVDPSSIYIQMAADEKAKASRAGAGGGDVGMAGWGDSPSANGGGGGGGSPRRGFSPKRSPAGAPKAAVAMPGGAMKALKLGEMEGAEDGDWDAMYDDEGSFNIGAPPGSDAAVPDSWDDDE